MTKKDRIKSFIDTAFPIVRRKFYSSAPPLRQTLDYQSTPRRHLIIDEAQTLPKKIFTKLTFKPYRDNFIFDCETHGKTPFQVDANDDAFCSKCLSMYYHQYSMGAKIPYTPIIQDVSMGSKVPPAPKKIFTR